MFEIIWALKWHLLFVAVVIPFVCYAMQGAKVSLEENDDLR